MAKSSRSDRREERALRTSWAEFAQESAFAFGIGAAAALAWHLVVGSSWGDAVAFSLGTGLVGTGVALGSTVQARRRASPARLVAAYAEADRIGGGGRNPAVLRDSLIDASIPGAHDDPANGRLAYVYEAWRTGADPTEFEALVPDRLLD